MATTKKTEVDANTPVSLAAWKKAATHTVLCPSGARLGIRIPDLPAMIELGEIPQHLLETAIGMAKSGDEQELTVESVVQQREFTSALVLKTVVDPVITEADLKDIPHEDAQFIVEIATRARDVDAEGEHLGGLSGSARFRAFRGITDSTESLASE